MSTATNQSAMLQGFLYQTAIIAFFRAKDAFSPDKAIVVSDLDWLQMGFSAVVDRRKQLPFQQGIINETADGKFWLDVNGFARAQYRTLMVTSQFFQGIGILMAILGICGLLLDENDVAPIAVFFSMALVFFFTGVLMKSGLHEPQPIDVSK